MSNDDHKVSATDTPHYAGHRQRLRARFRSSGAGALADYELLELVLFRAVPRRDTKPMAKALLKKFGTFAGVVNAPPDRLKEVKGVGEHIVTELKVVEAAALQLAKSEISDKPVLSSWQKVLDYAHASMAHREKEQFRIIFLDRKNRLIADAVQQEGTINHTPVYPREVVKRALELSASSIILVHNHPSGDPSPSQPDIDMTRKIAEAAEKLGIKIHDHIIIAREGHASFRNLGLL